MRQNAAQQMFGLTAELDELLANVLSKTPACAFESHTARRLVEKLGALKSVGLAKKLEEYKDAGVRLGDLCAELRLAHALADHLGSRVTFQHGDAADLRIDVNALDLVIEVQHKSAPHAVSAVFYPDPVYHDECARDEPWQRSAYALHEFLAGHAVSVRLQMDGELFAPCWDYHERRAKEEACGRIADWLVEQLKNRPLEGPTELRCCEGHAQAIVKPIETAPGGIEVTQRDAFWIRDYERPGDTRMSMSRWLYAAVMNKSKKAKSRAPDERSAYVVGLVIDESYACQGHVLVNTLLGGLVGDPYAQRAYRLVPPSAHATIAEAKRRGRGALLARAQYDPAKKDTTATPGLFFDVEACGDVSGVVALYHSDELQFVPNPFSRRPLEALAALFPARFEPFHVAAR